MRRSVGRSVAAATGGGERGWLTALALVTHPPARPRSAPTHPPPFRTHPPAPHSAPATARHIQLLQSFDVKFTSYCDFVHFVTPRHLPAQANTAYFVTRGVELLGDDSEASGAWGALPQDRAAGQST